MCIVTRRLLLYNHLNKVDHIQSARSDTKPRKIDTLQNKRCLCSVLCIHGWCVSSLPWRFQFAAKQPLPALPEIVRLASFVRARMQQSGVCWFTARNSKQNLRKSTRLQNSKPFVSKTVAFLLDTKHHANKSREQMLNRNRTLIFCANKKPRIAIAKRVKRTTV